MRFAMMIKRNRIEKIKSCGFSAYMLDAMIPMNKPPASAPEIKTGILDRLTWIAI